MCVGLYMMRYDTYLSAHSYVWSIFECLDPFVLYVDLCIMLTFIYGLSYSWNIWNIWIHTHV